LKLYTIIREILNEAWDTSISKKYVLLFNNNKNIPSSISDKYKSNNKNFTDQVKDLKKSRTDQFLNDVIDKLGLSPIKTLNMDVVTKPNYVYEVDFDATHQDGATSKGKVTFDGHNVVFYATKFIYNDGSEKILMDPNTPEDKIYKKKHVPKEKLEPVKTSKPEKNVWDVPDAKKKITTDKAKEKKEKEKDFRKGSKEKKKEFKKEKEQLPAEYQKYVKPQGSWMLQGVKMSKIEDSPENIVKFFIKTAAQFIGYDMKKEAIATGSGRNWNVKYGDLSADIKLGPLGKFDIRDVVIKFDDYIIFKYKEPQ
jgi:hypothetical protein